MPGGFPHWFQSAFYWFFFGVLAVWLLFALSQLEEAAEKQEVELTIRNMRTGLQLATMEALIQGRGSEVSGWGGTNPVRWLGGLPRSYLGECSISEALSLQRGAWCFDHDHRELLYRPHNSGRLHLQGIGVGAKSCDVLRWNVNQAGVTMDRGFVGARLDAVGSCRWMEEEK